MNGRERTPHPNKAVEREIHHAEAEHWRVELQDGSNLYAKLVSPYGDVTAFVWAKPRHARNHARQLRRIKEKARWEPYYRALREKREAETHQTLIDFRSASAELIDALARDPSVLHQLHWREFEELVAELLSRQGFDVTLTSPSGDRGVDIYAKRTDLFGPTLYVVECKKYDINRPVGPDLVRMLYGVVERERASRGVLATTSVFTAGAREEVEGDLAYRMSLRDGADIAGWARGDSVV